MRLCVSGLLTKAKTFAIALNISDFKGTGWVNGFQEQLGLHQYYRNGEAASSSPIETLNKYRECLQEFCERYTLENIWNANETSLYWKMHSSKTLAQGPVSGYKKEKV